MLEFSCLVSTVVEGNNAFAEISPDFDFPDSCLGAGHSIPSASYCAHANPGKNGEILERRAEGMVFLLP